MPVPATPRLTFQSVTASSSRNAAAASHSPCSSLPQTSQHLPLLTRPRPRLLLLLRPARRPISSTTPARIYAPPPNTSSTRYIPPHLRSVFPSPFSGPPSRSGGSHTLSQITAHFNLTSEHGTLNPSSPSSSSSSSSASKKLAFVLVFNGQHPDWKTEGKVLCKKNLELLSSAPSPTAVKAEEDREVAPKAEGQEASPSETALPTHPIPIFTQLFRSQARQQQHSRPRLPHLPPPPPVDPRFRFAGYYRMREVQYLEPRSPALEAMLERKFAQQQQQRGRKESRVRGERARGLEIKWAVVGFERVGGEVRGWEDPLRGMKGVVVGGENREQDWMEDEVEEGKGGEGHALKGILEGLRLGESRGAGVVGKEWGRRWTEGIRRS